MRRGKIKNDKPGGFVVSVPHTRVELVIYCVRGSCPGPLDECGVPFVVISLSKSVAKVLIFSDMAKIGGHFFLLFFVAH